MSSTPGGLIEEYLSREKRTETDAGLPITTITTHRTYTTNSAPGETLITYVAHAAVKRDLRGKTVPFMSIYVRSNDGKSY